MGPTSGGGKPASEGGRSDERHGIAVHRLGPGELRPAHGAAAVPPYAERACAPRARASAAARFSRPRPAPASSPQALHAALPDAEIVATDLNQPMLDVAARAGRVGQRPLRARPTRRPCRSRTAASTSSSASSASMFFPDKVARPCRGAPGAARRRALSAGDLGPDRAQPADRHRPAMLIEPFPDNPPLFMREGPFSYHDAGADRTRSARRRLRRRRDRHRRAAQPLPVGARCRERPVLRHADGRRDRGPRPGQPRARVRSGRAAFAAFEGPGRVRRADVGAHRHRRK